MRQHRERYTPAPAQLRSARGRATAMLAGPAPDGDRHRNSASLGDISFRRLLGESAWQRLPTAIRERFAVKPARGGCIEYRGVMRIVRRSRLGWVFAQLCRLFGTPLPLDAGVDVPTRVSLYLDATGTGIVWARCYEFPATGAVTILSTKAPDQHAGLVERIGGGFAMALAVAEEEGALRFDSTGYFWTWRGLRVPIPLLLTPGRTHVVHRDEGDGRFRYILKICHPWFGETFFQDGIFAAAEEG